MFKQRVVSIIVALLVLVLTACSAAASTDESRATTAGGDTGGENIMEPAMPSAGAPPMEESESAEGAPADMDDALGGGTDGTIEEQQQNAQNSQTGDRKIIYTSSLILEVEDPRREAQALQGLAMRYGGFVSSGNVYEYDEDADGNPIFRADIQLRIPADNFNPAQEELRDMADEVVSEQIGTQDVTGEYTDVQSRIRNLQRLEEELQVLLAQASEREDGMDEVLSIYRELTRVREEIEVMQGRINVLSDLVNLATINVTLVAPEPKPAQIQVLDETWDPGVTFREALRAFTEDLQGLVDGSIWFAVTGLPRLLIVGLFLLIAFVIARRIWMWARPYLTSSGPTITPPPPNQ